LGGVRGNSSNARNLDGGEINVQIAESIACLGSQLNSTVRIESLLGSGGSGIVYKAWHKRLHKYVAVKALRNSEAADIEIKRNEVEALKNIKCPFVPQVYDFLSDGNRCYTILDFIEGESLDKRLAQCKRFAEANVIEWYKQLAAALVVMHKQDVCHCDIKPANIVLTPNGDVCLIDFNAAFVRGSRLNLCSRSNGYASPEQSELFRRCENAKEVRNAAKPPQKGASLTQSCVETQLLECDSKTELTNTIRRSGKLSLHPLSINTELPDTTLRVDWKRSDIYSLGAAMLHLLTGEHPAGRLHDLMRNGGLSAGIAGIIEKSVQKEPAKRYKSSEQLMSALLSF